MANYNIELLVKICLLPHLLPRWTSFWKLIWFKWHDFLLVVAQDPKLHLFEIYWVLLLLLLTSYIFYFEHIILYFSLLPKIVLQILIHWSWSCPSLEEIYFSFYKSILLWIFRNRKIMENTTLFSKKFKRIYFPILHHNYFVFFKIFVFFSFWACWHITTSNKYVYFLQQTPQVYLWIFLKNN